MKNMTLVLILSFQYSACKSQEIGSNSIKSEKSDYQRFAQAGFFSEEDRNPSNGEEVDILKTARFLFFGNGLCYYVNLGIVDTDSSNFKRIVNMLILKNFYGGSWGKFAMVRDTLIRAHFRYQFFSGGLQMKYYDTYFEGIFSGNDTITNWKMIPPYPKPKRKLNENFDSLKVPKTLIFSPSPAKKLIDSNNVWINKYDDVFWKY